MIKFIYFRDEKRQPIATIAYELAPKPSKEIKFNYSCCAMEDKYGYPIDTPNKALGKKIAEGRLAKKPMSFEFVSHPVRELLEQVNDAEANFPRSMKAIAFKMLQEREQKEAVTATE